MAFPMSYSSKIGYDIFDNDGIRYIRWNSTIHLFVQGIKLFIGLCPMVYPNVYHTGLPYRLPYMVYPFISENIPPKLKLREERGTPPWVAIKNAKNAFSGNIKKMILI